MNKNKLLILFILRLIIFSLFLLSGIAKLYPIQAFEKQLVDLGFADWCSAPYLSRAIIALEIALGAMFLQSNYLRRIVIPATSLLLIAFCVHLSITIYNYGANSGNCGCFGQLIPMTPLEALIKNVLTLGILAYMYFTYKERERGKNNILVLFLIYALTNLGVFLIYPFCPCNMGVKSEMDEVLTVPKDSVRILPDTLKPVDTVKVDTPVPGVKPFIKKNVIQDTTKVPVPVEVKDNLCPVKKVSAYAPFRKFSDGSVVDLDDGRKIVTLFSLECEHCMETARKIGELSRKRQLPGTYFLFWGSEDQVENFFKVAQCRFPYKIVEPTTFFQLLGSAPSPPKVTYLCNGNVIADFDNSSFTIEKLEEAINK